MSHHCLISGPGRAGTTFLVIVLTRLGVYTGFTRETATNDNIARAGLEHTTIEATSPYLIKNPWLCGRIDALIERDPGLVIDCALVPVRDLKAAAESRADVQERTTGSRSGVGVVGGLWFTTDPSAQEAILRQQLSLLIESLARHDIPLTLLWYPRLVRDPKYLYEKLKFLLPDTSFEQFERVFSEVARPDWVHQFSPADVEGTRRSVSPQPGQTEPASPRHWTLFR